MYNVTLNTFMPVFRAHHVHKSVGHIPRRGIPWSEGLALVDSAECSHQHVKIHQHVKTPVAPHSHQYLVLSVFLNFSNSGRWLSSF